MIDDNSIWDIMPEGVNDLESLNQSETNEDVDSQVEESYEEPSYEDLSPDDVAEYEETSEETPDNDEQEYTDEGDDEYSAYGSLMNALVNDGLINYDENKEYEDSEEGFKSLLNDAFESSKQEAVQDFYNSLPKEVKDVMNIVSNGGRVDDYFDLNQDIDYDNIDLEDVQTQRNLVEDYLLLLGLSDEEISDKIKLYENNNILSNEAVTAKNKLKANQASSKEEFIKEQKRKEENERIEYEQEVSQFKNEVLNTTSIKNFPINKKEASKLWDYITEPVNEDGLTAFQLDDTPEDRLFYAWFKMNNFNKDVLQLKERSKQVVKLKKELSNYSSSNSSNTGRMNERQIEDSSQFMIPDWFGSKDNN